MKKIGLFLIFAALLVLAGCEGQPVGDWCYQPTGSTYEFGDQSGSCYESPELNHFLLYDGCENFCADVTIYRDAPAEYFINTFDQSNMERSDNCGTWDYCWERWDQMLYLMAWRDFIVAVKMSRYCQCQDLIGMMTFFYLE